LNTPALVGGFLAHYVGKRSEKLGGERGDRIRERGVIIASGLMAGGALGGVLGAACRLIPSYKEDWIRIGPPQKGRVSDEHAIGRTGWQRHSGH
jgi:hypothetical protein